MPNYQTINAYGEYSKGVHAYGLNLFNDVVGSGRLTTNCVTGKYSWHYQKEKWGIRLGTGV
ncbi:MAG: hypothetical protein SGJ10_06320 [Bacteroidota bacterium]|nr:hypothetical protein [Bacteroidota bacterium]